MSILYVNDDDNLKKINIDELYSNEQKRKIKQISIFNKILNRIHTRITVTGRTKKNDRHIWFNIPEYIFGEPLYQQADCIAYIVSNLEENGFFIRYVHPNTLFISWENWIPVYIRNEIKKKQGIVIDEKGNFIKKVEENDASGSGGGAAAQSSGSSAGADKKEQKQYTPIQTYKPTGNLIYNNEFFEKIQNKMADNSGGGSGGGAEEPVMKLRS